MQPAIILVNPQLGENIGKAARAMLNFGLTDMRLVNPRDGWPNPSAGPAASGADRVLEGARVFESVQDAIADCTFVFATTVRDRDMTKPVYAPRAAATVMRERIGIGERPAVLFGAERSGLTNDEVAAADAVLTVPVNPDFGSLNLAQAVILVAYEFALEADAAVSVQESDPAGLATKAEFEGMMEQLIPALEARGFFRSEGRRDTQLRMLRNLMHNAGFSAQEIQTVRGVIKALTKPVRD